MGNLLKLSSGLRKQEMMFYLSSSCILMIEISLTTVDVIARDGLGAVFFCWQHEVYLLHDEILHYYLLFLMHGEGWNKLLPHHPSPGLSDQQL